MTETHTSDPAVTAHWSASDWGSGVAAYQMRTRLVRDGEDVPAWSVRVPTTLTAYAGWEAHPVSPSSHSGVTEDD